MLVSMLYFSNWFDEIKYARFFLISLCIKKMRYPYKKNFDSTMQIRLTFKKNVHKTERDSDNFKIGNEKHTLKQRGKKIESGWITSG